MMDFTLRCNSLKCRAVLTERAIVTTCSHIFCNDCSNNLGLAVSSGGNRTCPACQSVLPNPDDVVSTSLNPTDDYKTSVLSGLAPSIVVECAGRALAFWCYQSTQEIVYQEYLAKTLTDKYSHLNVQMDRLVNDANSELQVLNQKLSNIQTENDRIRNDNGKLVVAFREKSRKHQQTQELYDRLKRKEMTTTTQSAAFDSVEDVLGVRSSRMGAIPSTGVHEPQQTPQAPEQRRFPTHDTGFNGVPQSNLHHRRTSNQSNGSGGEMLPPPLRRPLDHRTVYMDGANPTPSMHRTRVGSVAHSPGRLATSLRRSAVMANGVSPNGTPGQRPPSGNFGNHNASRNGLSGYGMSAGMKVGRQQNSTFPSTSQFGQINQTGRQFTIDQQLRQENSHYP